MCASATTPAYYIPIPGDIFASPQSIFQDAAGTQPFNYAYVRDTINNSWTAPTSTYTYNSSTGAVGSTNVLTCL